MRKLTETGFIILKEFILMQKKCLELSINDWPHRRDFSDFKTA